MNRLMSTLGSIGLGAGLMYFYDPDRGRRRRAMVRDQAVRMVNQSDDFIDKAARDMRNRARGVMAEGMALISDQRAPDWILEERVRAEMGRIIRHPRLIQVQAFDGGLTLTGPILADEVDQLISRVSKVYGVQSVNNQLDVYQDASDLPGLQGEGEMMAGMENRPARWSPTARLLAGAGGGLLAAYGRSRRGLIGSGLSLVGLGLLARSVTNFELKRLITTQEGRPVIDVQKVITIHSPVERVYEFWSHYENFPRFMAHVREIRPEDGNRSHWVVAGPAGIPVEFDAITTREIPNQLIAWRSLPDQEIKTSGSVRFEPVQDGATRVTVQMSYTPPAGALGHTVAALFGADPKQAMDEDLARLKSLLEVGKTSVEGQTITHHEVSGGAGL